MPLKHTLPVRNRGDDKVGNEFDWDASVLPLNILPADIRVRLEESQQ